jgi:hypothetical protein
LINAIATTTDIIATTTNVAAQLSKTVQTIEQADEVLDDEVWTELEVVIELIVEPNENA